MKTLGKEVKTIMSSSNNKSVWKYKKIIIFIVIIVIMTIGFDSWVKHLREESYETRHGQSFYSPDKRYKAVLFNINGGGGISPYCVNTISVVPSNIPDSIACRPENIVYLADCHSVGIQHTKDSFYHVNDPIIRWISNKELGITFAEAREFQTTSRDNAIKIIQEVFQENNSLIK